MSLASYRAAPPRVVASWTSELASGFGTISVKCVKSSDMPQKEGLNLKMSKDLKVRSHETTDFVFPEAETA